MEKQEGSRQSRNTREFVAQLAKAADLDERQAKRVLEVLGIEKLVENYRTAETLVKEESARRALGISEAGRGRHLPEFTFANLGLVLHDRAAALADIPR